MITHYKKMDGLCELIEMLLIFTGKDKKNECALNALAIDDPPPYAKQYIDGNMQMWIDAEDSLELW